MKFRVLPLLLLGGLLFPAVASADQQESRPTDYAVFRAFEDTITSVSEKVIPLVVYIEAVQKRNNRKQKVSGSGFIAGKDGVIITNEHVVDKAQKIQVSLLNDKRKYPAKVIGTDAQTDIAVIKIDPPAGLPLPTFGSYEKVRVGEGVLAVGNPYGLDGTVSFGIVSAKGRNLNVGKLINDFLQTDAMIDHGSSGGPLVNLRGEIIGVNSMGQGRGIGFTIPINTALEVRDRLLKSGDVQRGWLGVTVQPLNRELADFWKRPELTGAIVTHVIEDSPAAKAGMKTDDIIVSIGGEPLDVEEEKDLNNFRRAVAALKPGDKTRFKVLRDWKPRELMVAMGEQPKIEGDEVETNFGFTVQEITASIQLANRLPDRDGVFVSFVEKDSVAAEAGLLYGEVIQFLNGVRVKSLQDFAKQMEKIPAGQRFLIKARSGDSLRYHLLIPYGKNIKEVQSAD
jgi:serine protease Do